jgi:hypothetical protein
MGYVQVTDMLHSLAGRASSPLTPCPLSNINRTLAVSLFVGEGAGGEEQKRREPEGEIIPEQNRDKIALTAASYRRGILRIHPVYRRDTLRRVGAHLRRMPSAARGEKVEFTYRATPPRAGDEN